MKSFLEKEGFTVKKITTWSSYNTYHNQVENNEIKIDVAFKGENILFNDETKSFRSDSVDKFKITNVFTDALKSKLLSL